MAGGCADGPKPDPLPVLEIAEGSGIQFGYPLDWIVQVTILGCDERSLRIEPNTALLPSGRPEPTRSR